jgi:hypothetical protein
MGRTAIRNVLGGSSLVALALAALLASPAPTRAADLPVPPDVFGIVYSSSGGLPIANAAVEIWRATETDWQFETTVTADVDGWWQYSVDDSRTVRVRAVDPSGMHDPIWYAGANDLLLATDVLPGDEWYSFADIEMPLARPATVRGTVRSAVGGVPLDRVYVALVTASDGYTVFETETAADGTYAFSEVPAGTYAAYFEDLEGLWDPQWWSGGATIEEATPIVIAAPGTTECSPGLKPMPTEVPAFWCFGRTSQEEALDLDIGQYTTFYAEVYNKRDGARLTGKRIIVQCSLDGVNWVDVPEAVVRELGGGAYEADVMLDRPGQLRYRLMIPATEFSPAAISSSAWIEVDPWPITWYACRIGTDFSTVGRASATGAPTRMWANMGGVTQTTFTTWPLAVLQRTTDGVTWVDDPTVAVERGDRLFSAIVPARPGLYRFSIHVPRMAAPLVSPAVQFYASTSISIKRSARSVRRRRSVTLSGSLTPGAAGDWCVLEVKQPGRRSWTALPGQGAYRTSGRSGLWSCRYKPTRRGTYSFRVRYGGSLTRSGRLSGVVTVRVR